MTLLNKIKPFLDYHEISVYKFRKSVNIASETAYQLYKNPRHLPSAKTLEKICDYYKCQPSEFLYWVEDSD